MRPPRSSTLFPYTTLFRSAPDRPSAVVEHKMPTLLGLGLWDHGRTEHRALAWMPPHGQRSEEHTSELQSPVHLVCRLLLEKKKGLHYNERISISSNCFGGS